MTVSACSDRETKIDECSITVDTVKIIDSKTIGGNTYYLVHRVSGWQDKVEILELYNEKPIFDHCSIASVDPIDGDSIEMSKSISHVYLNSESESLDIEYIDDKPVHDHQAFIRLEVK